MSTTDLGDTQSEGTHAVRMRGIVKRFGGTTVLDARRLGYRATLLAALTRPVDPDAVPALHAGLEAAGATVHGSRADEA